MLVAIPRLAAAVQAWILIALVGPGVLRAETPRPNVLLLFADDQRADTIATWGNPHIRTPNLDRLARRGTRFRGNSCFGSNSGAVCVPSRAMLMSGRTCRSRPTRGSRRRTRTWLRTSGSITATSRSSIMPSARS